MLIFLSDILRVNKAFISRHLVYLSIILAYYPCYVLVSIVSEGGTLSIIQCPQYSAPKL